MRPYSELVWQHFNSPRYPGRIENADSEGRAGSTRGGPFVVFTARLKGEVLDEVRFETYGCVPAIAAASFLCEAVRGRTIEEASGWTVDGLVAALGGLPGDKRHCAELALEALRKLLDGFMSAERKELVLGKSGDRIR